MRTALHASSARGAPSLARPLRAALVVALLLSTLPPAVAGSPRPITVCPPCEEPTGFDGPDLAVTASDVTIDVSADGSATWTATVTVANATALRRAAENGSLRRGVLDGIARLPGNPRLLALDISGDTFTARWRAADVARRTGGVLLVDYLRDDPGTRVFVDLGADSVTVVGPAGTEAVRAPGGARVDGRTVTMTSLPSGDGPFVAFGSGPFAGPRALFAVAALLAPAVLRNLAFLVAVPTAVFATGTVGLGAAGRRAPATVPPRTLALGVAALGALLAAHPLYVPYEPFLGSANAGLFVGAVAATLVGATLSASTVGEGLTAGRLVAVLAGAWLVGLLALAGFLALFDPPIRADVLDAGVLVLPPLSLLLAGYAGRRGVAVAVGAFLVTDLWVVDVLSLGGYMFGLGVLLAVFAAVAALVGGVPLFALGRSLRTSRAE